MVERSTLLAFLEVMGVITELQEGKVALLVAHRCCAVFRGSGTLQICRANLHGITPNTQVTNTWKCVPLKSLELRLLLSAFWVTFHYVQLGVNCFSYFQTSELSLCHDIFFENNKHTRIYKERHRHTNMYKFSLSLFCTPLDIKFFPTYMRGHWKTKCKFCILWVLGDYLQSLTKIAPPMGCLVAILPGGRTNRVGNLTIFHQLHNFLAWGNW